MSQSKSVITNFIWRFLERTGAQLVAFVVSIVLARILEPEAYGTVALITVFTAILQVFVDSGLGSSLIQKKDADDLDFSTVFYTNIFLCVVIYIGFFLAAPLIAKFYDNMDLVPYIRVLGLTIVISGVKCVQQAYVSKNMIFKRFFFATLGGTIAAGVVGIIMAYNGLGVWALVAQQIINLSIDTIILWITVKWRPKWMFSFKRLKGLFSFGWKLFTAALLEEVYSDLRSLIIGKVYSSSDLAFYNRGDQFPKIIVGNINTSINSVLFPAMSKVQDSKESVKSMTRRSMKTSTYIMAPMLMGLAACGKSVISIILTDKWLPTFPFLVVFCITYTFYPVHTANLNAIKAMGRSDLFLKLEIAKKVIGLTVLLITFRISVMAMAYSLLFTSVTSQIINSWPNKKLMNYSYLEQLKDILPGIGLAGFMGICVYCVNFLHLNNWLTLIIQVPLGAIIFISLSAILKIETFSYCANMAKPLINKFIHKKNN